MLVIISVILVVAFLMSDLYFFKHLSGGNKLGSMFLSIMGLILIFCIGGMAFWAVTVTFGMLF
jgi:hypothetical protein